MCYYHRFMLRKAFLRAVIAQSSHMKARSSEWINECPWQTNSFSRQCQWNKLKPKRDFRREAGFFITCFFWEDESPGKERWRDSGTFSILGLVKSSEDVSRDRRLLLRCHLLTHFGRQHHHTLNLWLCNFKVTIDQNVYINCTRLLLDYTSLWSIDWSAFQSSVERFWIRYMGRRHRGQS